MKYISTIHAVIMSLIWILGHIFKWFKLDYTSIIFPCLWYVLISLYVDKLKPKEKDPLDPSNYESPKNQWGK